MVAIKAAAVEQFLRKPNPAIAMALVYGPDRGLVWERANRLSTYVLGDSQDPFAQIKLDGEDIAADPGRLTDEALTISMFGDRRLIWVRNAGAKPLSKALAPLIETPPEESFVLMEAGELNPSNALRKQFEACGHAVAIPCYADAGHALDQLIDSQLSEFELAIDKPAREALKTMLGGDRVASRAEIEKLCLYCRGRAKISLDDVQEVVGDAAALSASAVIDAAFSGQIARLEREYRRLIAAGSNGAGLMTLTIRHAQILHQSRLAVEGGKAASSVVDRMRPPVFFARKKVIIDQLVSWPSKRLDGILRMLDETALSMRLNRPLENVLPHRALLLIARGVASRR